MMICENDKLNIPEKYKKMSVSELEAEKKRIYQEFKKQSGEISKKREYNTNSVVFHF